MNGLGRYVLPNAQAVRSMLSAGLYPETRSS